MHKKLDILCDADDVIEQLVPHWVDELNRTHGRLVTPEEVTDWDMQKFYPGLTKEELYAPILRDGFWSGVLPMPGAYEGLYELWERGHNIYIVTATHYRTCREKIARLILMFDPLLDREDFIITEHKHMIRGDVLIDDGVHNLQRGEYRKILFTQPHNQSFCTDGTDIQRADNWPEVCRLIEKIETE